MNTLIGLLLFVFSSIIGCAVLGALFGFLSTAINNLILSPYFGAAVGSYEWWIRFHVKIWSLGGGVISLLWGLIIAFVIQRGPGKLG